MDGKNSLIKNNLDKIKRISPQGVEFWMARDIQSILGYLVWQNFRSVVLRGMKACESAGVEPGYHFVRVNKVIARGKGAEGSRVDYFLTRYACYLIAMNGNPKKPEIGIAQTYFAVQARKMEKMEDLEDDARRLELRNRVTDANNNLNSAAKQAGVQNYGFFHDAGYRGLYDMSLKQIKKKKNIPAKEQLMDRAGRTELAANEFRITQTEEKITRDNIQGQKNAENTHRKVGQMVRDTIKKLDGTMPEELKPATNIKKIKKKDKKIDC